MSSRNRPFQRLQWADHSARPARDYTCTIVPLFGTPAKLRERRVEARVQTEMESEATHSMWFNRGAIASHEYARRYQNRPPDADANGAA